MRLAKLNEEEAIFLSDMKSEFESDGVHLGLEDKTKSLLIKSHILELESLYMQIIAQQGSHNEDGGEVLLGICAKHNYAIRNASYLGPFDSQSSSFKALKAWNFNATGKAGSNDGKQDWNSTDDANYFILKIKSDSNLIENESN